MAGERVSPLMQDFLCDGVNSERKIKYKFFSLRKNRYLTSAAQKIKKLSETPATVPIVAKLCMFDSKNRKIAEKLVQPVTPHLGCFQWGLQWGNS